MKFAYRAAVAAAALFIAGCSLTTPPNPAGSSPATSPVADEAVAAWARAGGSADLANLASAIKSASNDLLDRAALGTACQQVSAAIARLQAAGPVPDQAAESSLTKALGELSAGASECRAGVQAGSVSMQEQAVIDVTAGATYLGLATTAIDSAAGMTNS
jgi:hypothetical protein